MLAHGFEALPTQSSVPGCKGGVAKLFVANCGDCRAILVRGRKARPLSEDHKPERRDETARIQKSGGIVIQDLNTGIFRVARKKGQQRLFLSTSRAFGDLELKEPRPLVIAEPEIVVHTLEPEDWAVVLGCDGVWGVLSDQDVADAVWQVMAHNRGGPVEAAQEVAKRSEAAGSTDNVTVLVMRLGWAQPPARMM
uniref:PPM-type phosphatase domain-containing protein n=1 Tax=Alexandrium catenella TaxID=2925 RepID=A0A7S1LSY6_ALECA